jgi:hypothetical protein
MNPQTTTTLVTVAIIVLVLGLRMRRMSQLRPLRLEMMWIMPAILSLVFLSLLYAYRPTTMDWLWIVAAAAVGAAIGWYRGKTMQIHVDPQTHALNQKASPLAMLFIVAIIGVRYGLRAEAANLHLNINFVTDASVAFAVGMFTAVRVEMFIRAKRLLAEAKAAKAGSSIVS